MIILEAPAHWAHSRENPAVWVCLHSGEKPATWLGMRCVFLPQIKVLLKVSCISWHHSTQTLRMSLRPPWGSEECFQCGEKAACARNSLPCSLLRDPQQIHFLSQTLLSGVSSFSSYILIFLSYQQRTFLILIFFHDLLCWYLLWYLTAVIAVQQLFSLSICTHIFL